MEAGCHTTPMLADKGTRKVAFSDSYDVVDFFKTFFLNIFFLKTGCSENCEKCSNGYDCLKCNSETSSLKAPGLRTTCVKSCPLGYTKQGDRAKGKSCQLIKRSVRGSESGLNALNLHGFANEHHL